MLQVFDYVFLRIYQFFKEKGDNVPETKGVLILSLMQCLTLVDIDVLIELLFGYTFFSSKFVILIPGIVIAGLNWYRYERDFDVKELEDRWKDEENSKRIMKGWAVGLYLLTSFLIPAVYGYLKHNVKAI